MARVGTMMFLISAFLAFACAANDDLIVGICGGSRYLTIEAAVNAMSRNQQRIILCNGRVS